MAAATIIRGPNTTVYANNTEFSSVAAGTGGLDVSVTPLDLKQAKLAVWELTLTGASTTHDTQIGADEGGRILFWAIGPIATATVVPSASTITASLAISTGIFTFTGGASRSFTLLVWYA